MCSWIDNKRTSLLVLLVCFVCLIRLRVDKYNLHEMCVCCVFTIYYSLYSFRSTCCSLSNPELYGVLQHVQSFIVQFVITLSVFVFIYVVYISSCICCLSYGSWNWIYQSHLSNSCLYTVWTGDSWRDMK